MAKRKTQRAKSATASAQGITAAAQRQVQIIRESRPRRKADQDEVLDALHTGVAYSAGRDSYTGSLNRILRNPDPIIAQVGGWQETDFYEDMLRRHPWLAGIVDQRVEHANRDRVIVAGDPSVGRSAEIADLARRKWRKVQGSKTALGRGLKNGKFIGPGGLEKVFTRDPDGIVYVARLINRSPRSIKFRADGTALWFSRSSPLAGEEIPRRKMMFIRGGSLDSPYPEVELANVYPATYLIEKAVELMLDNIEEFGRPLPTVHMPRAKDALSKTERETIRAYARAVHPRFIELPTNESTASIDINNAPMASSGQIGRPELAVIEMLITWCYIRILRITQTLNKTGGSRSLEEVRYEITSDAARPDSQLLDDSLNAVQVVGDEYTGWLADFNDYNFPDEPEEILPRFETPTLSQEDITAMHTRTMDAVDHGLGDDLSKDWYLRVIGAEKAKNDDDRLGGVPKTLITKSQSTTTDKPAREITETEPKSLADVAARANEIARELDALVGLAAA